MNVCSYKYQIHLYAFFLIFSISHVVNAYANPVFGCSAVEQVSTMDKSISSKINKESASTNNQKSKVVDRGSLQWTEKYRPKVPNDIVGNQSMVRSSAFGYVGHVHVFTSNLV